MNQDPRIINFSEKIKHLKENLKCEGLAFFVSDSKDVSRGELAEEGIKHAEAMIEVVENRQFRDATDLGM